jgi:ferredoxin
LLQCGRALEGPLHVALVQSRDGIGVKTLCLGTGFCAVLAPEHFSLERQQIGAEPLGIADADEKLVDLDRLRRAAESCPWRAIYLKDSETGDYIVRSG